MKCDFCGDEAVGYSMLQIAIYCAVHQADADKLEAEYLAIQEEVERRIADDITNGEKEPKR